MLSRSGEKHSSNLWARRGPRKPRPEADQKVPLSCPVTPTSNATSDHYRSQSPELTASTNPNSLSSLPTPMASTPPNIELQNVATIYVPVLQKLSAMNLFEGKDQKGKRDAVYRDVFTSSLHTGSLFSGATMLLQTCGVGRLRPNTLVLEFPTNW
jgi:hypothetical protein